MSVVGDLKLSRNDYNVKYLDLSHCDADKGVLEKLISSCLSLQKLLLVNLELNSNAIKLSVPKEPALIILDIKNRFTF